MAITVGDIYTAFPTFKPKDMIELVGRKDFNGRTEVSLSKIAHYKGGMAQELSVLPLKKRVRLIQISLVKQKDRNLPKRRI